MQRSNASFMPPLTLHRIPLPPPPCITPPESTGRRNHNGRIYPYHIFAQHPVIFQSLRAITRWRTNGDEDGCVR